MNKSKSISRRRFISIVASAAGSSLMPSLSQASQVQTFTWHGEVLGGLASVKLHTEKTEKARFIWKLCLTEINRLEKIFSLYRADSSIRILNKKGFLKNPPTELVEIIKKSLRLGDLSDGAFDISIQPLWHYLFYTPNGSLDAERVSELSDLVDYRNINLSKRLIFFSKPGMMITLNGIAQGYITDSVTRIFRQNGFENVLVELGETCGSGRNAFDRPWQIGVQSPTGKEVIEVIELENMSLATSGGYGTPFGNGRSMHHLIDPETASSANRFKSVSVIAPKATDADGLSTTLSLTSNADHKDILRAFPHASAYILSLDNTLGRVTPTDGTRTGTFPRPLR